MPSPTVAPFPWSDVWGQDAAVEALRHAASDPASLSHAWLITGPPGSGRSTLAYAFAAALIAEGYAGLIAPSFAPAALPGDLNMVLWRWGDALPCRLVLNDRDGRLARPPADPA